MNKTRLFMLSLAVAMCAVVFQSQAQINTPQPSPAGSTGATVGLTDISIDYFRPQMKGRKIFGDGADFLVPFGKRWRAGANTGTVITFSENVKVAGSDVPAGEYLLILTPGASEWGVILYSDKSLGSNVDGTEDGKITVNAKVAASKLTEAVQTLTYNVSDISENSENANIQMAWENTAVNIPVQVSFDETVMAAIDKNTKVNPGNYVAAANYYFNTGKDIDQALAWMDMYLAVGENSKQFWHLHTKAKMLAKKGDKKAAKKTAEESKKLASEFERGDFGYIKRNEDLIKSL